jgi:hypothetical protein
MTVTEIGTIARHKFFAAANGKPASAGCLKTCAESLMPDPSRNAKGTITLLWQNTRNALLPQRYRAYQSPRQQAL